MIEPKPKTVLELFKNHPERWTQGYNARDNAHTPVTIHDPTAACWCLRGAIEYIHAPIRTTENGEVVSIDHFHRALEKTRQTMMQLFFTGDIINFNDSHSFDEVMIVVRNAGI